MCVPRVAATGHHSKKKTLIPAEQLQPDVIAERTAWEAKILGIDPSRFVFLDEANAKTNMTRLYGRALCGQRVNDYQSDARWSSTTMLAAVNWHGAGPCLTYSGGTDVAAMLTFVEQLLAPTLGPENIVVMDNLSSHKHPSVIAAIEATGAKVWFQPRYSPDYNPIEKMWSKVKAILRKISARTTESLLAAIGEALKSITASDAQNWFRHCGYLNPNTDT